MELLTTDIDGNIVPGKDLLKMYGPQKTESNVRWKRLAYALEVRPSGQEFTTYAEHYFSWLCEDLYALGEVLDLVYSPSQKNNMWGHFWFRHRMRELGGCLLQHAMGLSLVPLYTKGGRFGQKYLSS